MGSFTGLCIGLSFLFGFIVLVLAVELYYVLWWKKRFTTQNAPEFSYLFCWKIANYVKGSKSPEQPNSEKNLKVSKNGSHEQDLELGEGKGKDFPWKNLEEESVEAELMRLHNLSGPPRLLFTIKEETEDLESEDGKSRGERRKSSSDFPANVETPGLTPLTFPTVKGQSSGCYYHHGFNPLFESSTDAEINRLRNSPPPTFKFLRDAEEKLLRKLMEESGRKEKCQLNGDNVQDSVSKRKESQVHHQLPLYHSTASQVLPLATSPSTVEPLDNKSIVQ